MLSKRLRELPAPIRLSSSPEGWEDVEFEYFFDVSIQVLQIVLVPNHGVTSIPLQLDRDAEFRWRGIQVSNPNSSFGLRFRTPDGTYLQDDYQPMQNFSGFPGVAWRAYPANVRAN